MSTTNPNLNLLSTIIKQASAEKLFSLLNSIQGQKDLVLDKELICSLDNIANFSQLKACNVDAVFKLESGSAPGKSTKCVYVIKPSIQNTKIIADHINACKSVDGVKSFWLINVPRKICSSEFILEREGVYGYITHMEMPLVFLSIDKDLLSLEISNFFEAFYLNGDLTHVHTAAMALVQLCKICGPIPKIFGQGRCAKMVVELMNLIMDESDSDFAGPPGRISHLVILDRDIDYIPLLLSQLTYEGMLDEFYGINNGRIIFPKEVTGKEPLKVGLNSNDVVYEAIRNDYFASVFGFLGEKAKELQAKSATSKMTLGEIKHLVEKELRSIKQQHTSLSLHIGACELIIDRKSAENFQDHLRIERDILEGLNLKDGVNYTEDMINKLEPYSSALRLMCLLSISQDGMLSADYNMLATGFRESYGCKYAPTVFKLNKLGLFMERGPYLPSETTTRQSKISEVATVTANQIAEKVATAVAFPKYSPFRTITKKFNLIPSEKESIDLKNPKNMSYVFGGSYVPLIGRITEQIVLHGDLKNLEDSMKLLPGSTIISFKANKETGYVISTKQVTTKTVMVYVLGGITFAEIAALRLIGQLHGCKILIATTSFISGGSLMKMLSPNEEE